MKSTYFMSVVLAVQAFHIHNAAAAEIPPTIGFISTYMSTKTCTQMGQKSITTVGECQAAVNKWKSVAGNVNNVVDIQTENAKDFPYGCYIYNSQGAAEGWLNLSEDAKKVAKFCKAEHKCTHLCKSVLLSHSTIDEMQEVFANKFAAVCKLRL